MQDRCFGLVYTRQPEFVAPSYNIQIMPDFSEMNQKPESSIKKSRKHLGGNIEPS